MSTNGTSTPGRRSTWQQLKRRPPVLAPYRNVPQDRGDTILAQEATALLRGAGRRCVIRGPPAETQSPRRFAEQGRRHALDGGRGCRIRDARDARTESHQRGCRRDQALDARHRCRHQRQDGDRAKARVRRGRGVSRGAAAGRAGRSSQGPSASAVPHQTALHGAAEKGFTAFVKFLAENGADIQAKDANGRTPLDLANGVGVPGVRQAVREPFPETVALLESLMAAKGIAFR